MAKVGRNDPCPCGSGNKYKRCCLEKDEAKAREAAKPRPYAPPPGVTVTENAPPPPREPSPEMAHWDAYWERFHAASNDEKLAIAHEAIGSEDFDGEYAFELGNALQEPLAAARRWDDLDAFYTRIEREHPEAHADSAGYIALFQAENELEAARGGELEAMRRLGVHFADVSECGHRLLDGLRFHGRADLVEALLSAAWPHVKESELFDWAKDDCRSHLVDAIVVRHRAQRPSISADDAALLAEIAPLFEDRVDAERAVASWLGSTPRTWSYGDFARVDHDDDTSLRDLFIGFRAVLESRAGFPSLRAEMAMWSVFGMVRHAIERRNHDRDRIGVAPPTAAQPFPIVPSPEDASLHGEHEHVEAAMLLALPHWGAYLADVGLVDLAKAEGAWRQFRNAARTGHGRELIDLLVRHRDVLAANEVRAALSG